MTTYDGALLWCAAQALVVAGLGLLAVRVLARRAPASAATAAAAAVATIVLATLLVPVRLPTIELGRSVSESVTDDSRERAASAATAPDADATGGPVSLEGYAASVKAALRRFAALAQGAPMGEAGGISKQGVVVGILLASAAAGLAQFALALATVAKLRRSRRPIADESLHRLFGKLKARLDVRRPIELCESPAIASPALIGWRRPVVLLPVERAGWTNDQLRATLAHELAHVARGDFFWRAVARLAVAIHFYQPAVHWLARRLALLQEVGADRLAAQAAGGAAVYVKSLSELAIRLDDHSRLRPEPLVLPALSSHLARRMAMLRSKEGSNEAERRRIGGVLAAALIALVGAGTTALRGAAETGDTTPTPGARGAFAVKPVDLSFMGPVDVVCLVVRPRELSRCTGFTPLINLAEQFVHEQLACLTRNGASASQVRFDAIDYMAYSLRNATPADIADNPALAAETSDMPHVTCEIAVRLVAPADVQTWLAEHVPHATAVEEDGLSYVRIPMGDGPNASTTYVAQRDPHTVVLACSADRLRKLMTGDGDAVAGADAETWNAIGGGMAAVAFGGERRPRSFTAAELATAYLGVGVAEGEPNPMETAARDIFEGPGTIGIGLDLDPASNRLSLRMKFDCADATTAERVRDGVGLFQHIFKTMLDRYAAEMLANPEWLRMSEQIEALDEGTRMFCKAQVETNLFAFRLLADATLELRPRGDEAVDVWFEAGDELPASLLASVAHFRDAMIAMYYSPPIVPKDDVIQR